MTLTLVKLVAALVSVLNAETRPPALSPLARIKYPTREIQPVGQPDGSYSVKLPLYGWEYKHRGSRPVHDPVDTVAVQVALNNALPDGISITSVQDANTYILLKMEVLSS